jgi:hypothetical protein
MPLRRDLHSSDDDFKAAAASKMKNVLLRITQLTQHVAEIAQAEASLEAS